MSRRQLLAAGVTRGAIGDRVRAGLLVVLFRGVYCLGKPGPRSVHRGALLAAGDGAVLSHASATWAAGLIARPPAVPHVSVARHLRSRPGLVVHCVRSLEPREVTVAAGFPCTTVARTLVDLAATEPRRRIERMLDEAERVGLLDEVALGFALGRHCPGAARLRAVLADHAPGTTITRSELEESFLRLCRRAGLSQPVLNAPLVLPSGREISCDALWPRASGRRARWACGPFAQRGVRARPPRDVELTVAGYLPCRFTWRQVTGRGDWVVRQVRGLLRRGREAHSPGVAHVATKCRT